jgi:DNA primase
VQGNSRNQVRNQVNIVDEIKSRCNIVDVIGRVVPLKKAGSNFKGLCPFHNEKTPSFVVSEPKQIFTCFGCGAGGDVISFVEKYYNLDFKGAAEMLAREYGIDVQFSFGNSEEKDELYEINREAAVFFYKALRGSSNAGYRYMRSRGFTDETLKQFGIGWADDEWTSLTDYLISRGYNKDKLAELGLVSNKSDRYYDKLRSRVIFPIINTGGKIIGFGGRIVGEGEPKYLNSPETMIFKKKNNLYGLNITREAVSREDRIILVEGYMDVISLYQAGIRNVSASLGTALTHEQARLIKRYTSNVTLSYDADEAGQDAADRGLDILYKEGCRASVLKVTDGKDPDDFVKSQGRQAFLDLVDTALPYGDFKIGRLRERYSLDDEQQKIEFIQGALAVLKQMKPVEADIYIRKLASETQISEGALRMEYGEGKTAPVSGRAPAVDIYKDHSDPDNISQNKMSLAEKNLLKLMLMDYRFTVLPEDIKNDVFTGGSGKALYRALVSADRGDRPLDIDEIKDFLNQSDSELLDEITKKIIPGDKEQAMFDECIEHIRLIKLKEEDRDIRLKLSLADNETDQQKVRQLMERHMEIQRILKKDK